MVSPNLPELNLDLGPPVDTNRNPGLDFSTRVWIRGNYEFDDLIKMNDFITGLEDELRKIQAFKRELPLSCLLLNDAIIKLKENVKRRKEGKLDGKVRTNLDEFEKKSWMSSAQLWNPRSEEENESKESHPRNYTRVFSSSLEYSIFSQDHEPRLSLSTPVDQTAKPEIKSEFNSTAKRQRRFWSPELHRRFVDALKNLGGSQVATPKQIRELMQVDGLTNDEVKSHLQKYRLHFRKLPSSKTNPSSSLLEMLTDHAQLELCCSNLDLQHSGSRKGPLHLARSGKCNSTGMEEDEDKSDA